MAERKFTLGLNKPGMAAQLRETVSQVVRESAVLVSVITSLFLFKYIQITNFKFDQTYQTKRFNKFHIKLYCMFVYILIWWINWRQLKLFSVLSCGDMLHCLYACEISVESNQKVIVFIANSVSRASFFFLSVFCVLLWILFNLIWSLAQMLPCSCMDVVPFHSKRMDH